MKLSLANRLYLGFTLVVVLVLLGGYLTWQTFTTQTQEAGWVQQTYRVLNNVERIQRLLFDMESSRRGFRSTFNRHFLEPYELNLPKVAPTVNDLRTMVADNPVQYGNVDSLQTAVNTLLSYWNELDHASEHQRFEQNASITEKEALLMDLVRARMSALTTEERRLLTKQEKDNSISFTKAVKSLMLNNLFILLVGFVLMRVTYLEFKRRMRAQEALNNKLDEVVKLNTTVNERNWLLTGANEMNDSLHGVNNREVLLQHSLETLVRFVPFAAGAIYCYDELHRELHLAASVNMPVAVPKTVPLTEGFIGTSATARNIQVVPEVPAGYWQLSSASGGMIPGALAFVPLRINEEILGVIELAAFKEITPLQLRLMEVLSTDISVALNAANARAKILGLLQQVQEQKETLLAQQEELRQSNDELSRQSEVLQASEEELRVQEEELRQVNVEMMEKNTALEAARSALALKAGELEASSRYKSEFLANMSHELRTPLNSVLILAKILQENKDNNLTGKQIEYAGIIYKSGSDLLQLINDVLDLSKIEAGKVDLNYDEVRISAVISDLSDLFEVLSQERKIRFVKKVAPDIPETIRTDKLRLEQVIRNLLSNAFKFTPAGGEVTLSWYMNDPGMLGVSVSDTGPGIPQEQQALIFSAFQQGDGSISRKYGGTGLGLSISTQLMALLHGGIRLEKSSSEGSTFSIHLPVNEEAISVIAETPAATNEIQAVTHIVNDDRDNINRHDKLVLIIEDDVRFADILRDFARDQGFKTVVANNGQDGLDYARKYLPTAIILDMNLPDIDGASILKILKSNEQLSKILVHVVTGADMPRMREDNIYGYTRKPLKLKDLEDVFAGISDRIQSRLKKVLLVSSGPLTGEHSLPAMSEKRNLGTAYDIADIDRAERFLWEKQYDAVIVEISEPLDTGIAQLQTLSRITEVRDTPLIVYLDQDITSTEEQQLKKFASTIVRNAVHAHDRLMDELELFLYKLTKQTSSGIVMNEDINGTLSGKTVLLADDDMRNVFSISALMQEHGANVLTAADGRKLSKYWIAIPNWTSY